MVNNVMGTMLINQLGQGHGTGAFREMVANHSSGIASTMIGQTQGIMEESMSSYISNSRAEVHQNITMIDSLRGNNHLQYEYTHYEHASFSPLSVTPNHLSSLSSSLLNTSSPSMEAHGSLSLNSIGSFTNMSNAGGGLHVGGGIVPAAFPDPVGPNIKANPNAFAKKVEPSVKPVVSNGVSINREKPVNSEGNAFIAGSKENLNHGYSKSMNTGISEDEDILLKKKKKFVQPGNIASSPVSITHNAPPSSLAPIVIRRDSVAPVGAIDKVQISLKKLDDETLIRLIEKTANAIESSTTKEDKARALAKMNLIKIEAIRRFG